MSSPLFRTLFLLGVTVPGLVACSHEDAPASAKPGTTPYVAVARGRIDIEGGLLRLSMPRDGVIASIGAHEGQHVHKGEILASLDSEPARLAVNAALAEQRQAEAQARALEGRMAGINQRAQRLTAAAAAGAGDQQSADDARDSATQLQGELDNARAAEALATQKVASARYELAQRDLVAPLDGQIVQRTVQLGATASSQGAPAFVLLPDQPRIVRAELNESFVRAVKVGMAAQVLDDSGSGMPAQAAHVTRIGEVFGASALEDDPLVRANTRTVECVLTLDGAAPEGLRIGQRVIVQFGAAASSHGKP